MTLKRVVLRGETSGRKKGKEEGDEKVNMSEVHILCYENNIRNPLKMVFKVKEEGQGLRKSNIDGLKLIKACM
jgi:hypothetical protein